MLIYFFIPIILYILIEINIMTIFICISLSIREMFRFKQISSYISIADVCFLRRRGGGFSVHANDTIIPRLLTLTNSAPLAPLPTHPPPTGIAGFWVLRACHWPTRARTGQWQHRSSTGALYSCFECITTTTQCVFDPH